AGFRLARHDDLGADDAGRQDGRNRGGARHRHPPLPPAPAGQGDLDQPDRLKFAEALEKVCIETVEAGDMTRDLAILIRADHPWLTTNQFLDKLDANLQKAMA